jgi:hypothetical protein
MPKLDGAILAGLFIGLAGCQALTGRVEPGQVIFQDDFSRPSSGWDRYHDITYSSDYSEGGYRIHVLAPNTDAWSNPRLDLADVRVEVDVTKLGGPDNNVFGVLCRYQDARNFYFFLASSDGYAGIGVYKDGRRRLLSHETLLPSSAIQRGQASNHLRADCEGHRLRLYVNGLLVAEAQAAEWGRGDIGLLAGSYDLPGTDVLFDNFSALQPQP